MQAGVSSSNTSGLPLIQRLRVVVIWFDIQICLLISIEEKLVLTASVYPDIDVIVQST